MSNDANRDVINWAGSIIGIGVVSLLGFVLWALVYHSIPVANANAFTLLEGVLSANVGMVVGFYFGSSSSSKKQADTINTLATAAQTTASNASTTDTVVLKPGDTATTTATSSGTTLHKDPP